MDKHRPQTTSAAEKETARDTGREADGGRAETVGGEHPAENPDTVPFARAADYVLRQIDRGLDLFGPSSYPAPSSTNHVYPAIANFEWTSGFWTGMLWLAYELTGEAKYRRAAESQLPDYTRRIDERLGTNTHDLGFLYTLSAVNEFRITGNPKARDTGLKAAELLISRYLPQAGIIQAWGDLNDPAERGRMIIDCLMNLPLLHWAGEQSGDPRYADCALSHVRQSAHYLVRPDRTTYHTYYMDANSGAPKYGTTHQGYADDSCWSRGQAWGIYGFMLSYLGTGDAKLLDVVRTLGDYFEERTPGDGVVYWDLVFVQGNEQERDSSASAIAACGLLELSRQLPGGDPGRAAARRQALDILLALDAGYTTRDLPQSNGVLKHGVYNKPRGIGIDECTIWGDYYYFEALVRVLKPEWTP
ncbi:glycoside hydrolase family 88 protein [Saccharibacillus sp. CPCC 101409]|uniref:glycoside hydrolase family 88 protein n=1 Tax=Saccharibacillus sp. CPCC 101409 TaxID=3058041 RepID=UPI002671C039|nr:glycoside hydrolase family 88 protein [Saccharibacillus sp. CPCC 101409]MDO3411894.1 glycoside hydrolase family 88 protein [Saccharibacillus sp. CPCC 101409]